MFDLLVIPIGQAEPGHLWLPRLTMFFFCSLMTRKRVQEQEFSYRLEMWDEPMPAPSPAVHSIGVIADSAFMLMHRRRGEAETGRVNGGCEQQALTARLPDLPADNLVQLDAR